MTRTVLPAALALCFLMAAAIYFTRTADPFPPDLQPIVDASHVIGTPSVMFRTLAPKEMHGRVSMVPAGKPGSTRHVSSLSCARVHYAGGTGLCLIEEASGATVVHAAYLFDRTFTRGQRIDLTGIPTRARVSPSGRMAAITVYAEEHAPNGEERLATSSIIIDVTSGTVLANLRDFTIDGSGQPPLDGPLDFAGVSFARDGDRFFATMSTAAEHYVVEGSIAARRVTVVASGMVSEALSSDGNHLIVKKQIGDRGRWQLAVFDLGTNTERALNQGPRSVDDQVEWLDARHVMYHDATEQGTGVWALKTDGIAGPQLLIPDAYSPSAQQ